MKKRISATLSIILMFSLAFSGCSGSADTATAGSAESGAALSPAEQYVQANGMTEFLADDIVRVCGLIGLECGELRADGKGAYLMDYSGFEFSIVFVRDLVSSISSGDQVFYSGGSVKALVSNYVATDEEKLNAQEIAKKAVLAILKAPSTAIFPGNDADPLLDWTISQAGDVFYVSSYVDAQNSYGAMLRWDFQIEITYTDGTPQITAFTFDGKNVM